MCLDGPLGQVRWQIAGDSGQQVFGETREEALVLGITEESSSQHCVCIYFGMCIYILFDIKNAYMIRLLYAQFE